ncbi:MAG: DNA polymerase Y family protein [Polyangiaceae bacterium]|jgi:protein ImuB
MAEIRLEIARARELEKAEGEGHARGVYGSRPVSEWPLAVVIAHSGRAVKTERDVLGGTKVDFVSTQARTFGVRVGQTVAAARAKCAKLLVRVVEEDAVRTVLERVAEASLAFGPTVAYDAGADVVWVEIGGCAHLHGGEEELARALQATIRAMGHACRVAVADGPRIAAAVARFAPVKKDGPFVVGPGGGADAMRVLPIAVLALDDDVLAWFAGLGMHSCGDLQNLPRRALGMRLGARAHDIVPLLAGEDISPLDAWRPPEVPEEHVELDWGASSLEALLFVVKGMCERLTVRLVGRSMAVSRLEIVFGLDRALSGGLSRMTFDVDLPLPMSKAHELLAVLRARLEREKLVAPVLSVTLRATKATAVGSQTLDLLLPKAKADRALPCLVAELAADLGNASIGRLELVDTWSADERTRLVPWGAPISRCNPLLVTSAIEPSRLVPAVPVLLTRLTDVELLTRVEAAEWWGHLDRTSTGPKGRDRHDWMAAWMSEVLINSFECRRALAWIEVRSTCRGAIEKPEGAWLRGWID